MITLITGNPGSGKTLWVLGEIEQMMKDRAAAGLPCHVYYNGIPIQPACPYAGEWVQLEDSAAADPHTLPAGAVVVIDEAYRLWPADPASKSSKVPKNIQDFATHRHRGHDYILIMQKSSQLHNFIRDLVGRHVHLEAPFGLSRATVYSWERLAKPGTKSEYDEALKSAFRYPVERFAWYKSADLHVKKKRFPVGKLVALGVFLCLLVLGVYGGYAVIAHSGDQSKKKAETVDQSGASQKAVATSSGLPVIVNGPTWAAQYAERVPGVPRSAPIYDAVFKPVAYPRVVGCASMRWAGKHDCKCNTQQGSIITSMTIEQCESWIRYGSFDPGDSRDIYAVQQQGSLGAPQPASAPSVASPPVPPVVPAAALAVSAPGGPLSSVAHQVTR